MCGIAGIFMADGRTASWETLEQLGKSLAHRGPDGIRTYVEKSLGLVHTRLSIIDLATGDQPLFSGDHLALVANGEIYNNPELRLHYSSYPYKTLSDCESILSLWQRYGMDTPHYLRGMFAFALYDSTAGTLFLARDPFGIKPLYYVEHPDFIAFASEPKALIQGGFATPTLRQQGVSELLQLRFTTGRQTIFQDILRVLPGETIAIQQGRIVKRQIVDSIRSPYVGRSRSDPENLNLLLEESVRVHLRSDVPYGLFLSGGIDSSCMLALMHKFQNTPLKTYSLGFPGTAMHDERLLARKMATSVGADHVDIDFSEDDFWHLLPQVAATLDDPVVDYAALPTFKLAQVAAQDVKVVLCGEGGDEVFAGYRRYQRAKRPRLLGGRLWREKGIFQNAPYLIHDLGQWDKAIQATVADIKRRPYSDLQRAQYIDFQHWLPNDLLTKLDRCLMRHGIEGRTPFIDREISPFGFFLEDRDKVSWGTGKLALRHWLAEHFPVAAPFAKKRGFNVPVGEWIKRQAAPVSRWVSSQAGIRDIAHPEGVVDVYAKLGTRHGNTMQAWGLLFYAVWHEQHVIGNPLVGQDLLK